VLVDAETRDHFVVAARNHLDGSRAAAFVLSALFSKQLPSNLRDRSINALATALTHQVDEIVELAVQGVGRFLWDADRDLALTCVGALARQASERGRFLREQSANHSFDPSTEEHFLAQLRQETRSRIASRSSFSDEPLLGLNLGERSAQVALPLLLAMLTPRPEEPLARSFLILLVQQVAVAWSNAEEARQDRRYRRNRGDFFDPDRISGLHESVASFALRLSVEAALVLLEPILTAIPNRPKQVAEFLDWFITVEDKRSSGEVFWSIWQAAADRFIASDLSASFETEYSGSSKLLRVLFLNSNWKDTARDWAPLHGNEQRIQNLFDSIPPSRAVVCAYACYLYKIGSASLPLPLIAIARKLEGQEPGSLLSEAAVFYLEGILRRIMQGSRASMLARDDVRHAVLFILDEPVEQGSSTAYKLREDFVTPRQ
jgi:hypothetical protein